MTSPSRSVLVTGSAGFIGSHVVERLLARGDQVYGVDNFDPFYARGIKEENLSRARASERFVEIEADIRDPHLDQRLPDTVDAVVHLAARAGVRPSIEQPLLYADVNIGGTARLLEWTRNAGVPSFIFGSSSSVYGNNHKVPFSESDPVDAPISPYAATKRAGELLCHTYHHLFGFGCVALRFFTVYGPRQRPDLAIHKFTRLLASGAPISQFGDGTSRRDYTYIDDILQGVEGAIEYSRENPHTFEIVNLGESDTVELTRLISLIGEALGVEPRVERSPMQPGDVQQTYADIRRARELLGYDPATRIEAGIPRFVEWFRQQA